MPLLILSDSVSINKLNINKNICFSWSSISISACLLLVVTEIDLFSSFIYYFFDKSVSSLSELSNNLLHDILIFLFLFLLLFLLINFNRN